MLTLPPPEFRPRRPLAPRKRTPPPAPPAALTLVAATYVEGTSVTLTFDRAVDVGGIDVGAITVEDEAAGYLFRGAGAATQPSPAVVLVPLVDVELSPVVGTFLTAGPGTGIVADDDGGTWAGVTELSLPFP